LENNKLIPVIKNEKYTSAAKHDRPVLTLYNGGHKEQTQMIWFHVSVVTIRPVQSWADEKNSWKYNKGLVTEHIWD